MKRIFESVFEAWDEHYTTKEQEEMWRSGRRVFMWTLGIGLAIGVALPVAWVYGSR